VLVLVLLLRPRRIFAFLLVVALDFLHEWLLWGMVPRAFERLFIPIGICIMLTHMIGCVHHLPVWPNYGFPSTCLLTLWYPRFSLSRLLVCRHGDTVGEHELDGLDLCPWGDQDKIVLHTVLDGSWKPLYTCIVSFFPCPLLYILVSFLCENHGSLATLFMIALWSWISILLSLYDFMVDDIYEHHVILYGWLLGYVMLFIHIIFV
jgi:hypothetical protein